MKSYLTPEDISFKIANLSKITFEVTDTCNLKCTYCGYGELYEDYDKREEKMLPVEKAIRLIDYLNEFWSSEMNVSATKNVSIGFYGGEPLLNMPFIRSVIKHVEGLRNPHRKFYYQMTTNALLLHKHIDFLVEHNFVLLISLDGDKDNTAYRVDKLGNPAFDRIIENVDILREKYPEYFNDNVSFNAVLHNKNSVEEIYKFFKERYDKVPYIGELNNMGIRESKRELFMSTYRNKQESLEQSENYEKIERDMFIRTANYRSASLFLRKYSGFSYHNYLDLLFDKREYRELPTGTCIPFSRKIYITVNGKILPCERIGHQFALGEVTNTEVNLDVAKIAEKYNAYYAKLDEQCLKCKNAKACKQCIFNLNDLDGKPVCHGFMDAEDFEDYVYSQMEFLRTHPEAYQELMYITIR